MFPISNIHNVDESRVTDFRLGSFVTWQSLDKQVSSSHITIHHSHYQVTVNPNNGKKERVYVDLRVVYPTPEEPGTELSFEEIWAANRGWLDTSWEDESVEEDVPMEEESVMQEPSTTSDINLLSLGVADKLVIHQDTPPKLATLRDGPEKLAIHQDTPPKSGVFRPTPPKMAIHRDASPKLAAHRDASPKLAIRRDSPEKLHIRPDVLQLDEDGKPIFPSENKIMMDENGKPIYPGASKPRKKKVVEENRTQISELPPRKLTAEHHANRGQSQPSSTLRRGRRSVRRTVELNLP